MGNYYSIITSAINDILAHGYDSPERVAHWVTKIKEGVEAKFEAPRTAGEKLRAGLASKFKSLVDQGRVLTRHPGVSKDTIERVRPRLREELLRRSSAATTLVSLNRKSAIDTALRRFTSWATSIPLGGSHGQDRGEVRLSIQRPLAGLPFEDRRLSIDQGQKMAEMVSAIVAEEAGAIAAEWHSNWRQLGYDYREDHKNRDGKTYLIRDSWAIQAGLVKPKAPYTEDFESPTEWPFCRCHYRYLYKIEDLPEEFLSSKGKAALAEAGKQIGT